MTYGQLRQRLEEFRDKLIEHRELFAHSVNDIIPTHPIRNGRQLEAQERELHRLLAVVDPYLSEMSPGRIKVHRASGNSWDIYREAVGNQIAIVKGPSLNDSILQLEEIIAVTETHGDVEEIALPRKKPEEQGAKSSAAHSGHSISISGGQVNFGDKGTININVTVSDVLKTAIAQIERRERPDPKELKSFRERLGAVLNHPLGKILSQIGVGEVLKHL
jgi:hypothetical protein